jgi:hypothetical protein
MGWSGSIGYYESVPEYVKKELRPELAERSNCLTSTKNFGSEVWYLKKDNHLAMGVILVQMKTYDGCKEFMTKMIDWDMGPYCRSKPPLKYLKKWAAAVIEQTRERIIEQGGLSEVAKYLNHKEVFIRKWAAHVLEKGEFPDSEKFRTKYFKTYKDFELA